MGEGIEDVLAESEHVVFLEVLNKKGFVLEERCKHILKSFPGTSSLFNHAFTHKGQCVEIDAITGNENVFLIVECKQTDYSWIAPTEESEACRVSVIYHELHNREDIFRVKQVWNTGFSVVTSDIPVVIQKNGKLERKADGRTVRIAFSDARDGVLQALKSTEAALELGKYDKQLIFTVVVTNADLYSFEYSRKEIDSKGNIVKYNPLKKMKFLVYNIAQEMKYGNKIIEDASLPLDNNKSVFVVNIMFLKEFIERLLTQKWDVHVK